MFPRTSGGNCVLRMVIAADSARRTLACADCGYGISVLVEPAACPMCRGTAWVASTGRFAVGKEAHAEQERQRQEREAVRGSEGQGHVEGARGEDREFPERLETRWSEIGLRREQLARGHDRAEEGRGAQGRQGDREQELSAR